MNSNKRKILFVSHEFSIGGSTVSLMSLIQGLKKYDELEIWVLLPYKKGSMAKGLFIRNHINCRQMWYRRDYKKISEKYSLKSKIFDLLNMLAVIKIYRYIKKEKFAIVCSNSTGVDVGARAAKLAKVPHIYYVREFMELDHGIEYRNKKCMRNLLEQSLYTVFISKVIEKYYKNKYQLKNTAQFYDGFIVQQYYKEHDILKKNRILLIQAGTFQEGKGTRNTIEMLYLLNEGGFTDWEMEFVGSGAEEYVKEMQNFIVKYHLESQITIGQFCLNMQEKLLQKDILIMNSKAEGFGRVTVEGMLAGCLVVGRKAGGTEEIIEDKVNGILFENENDFVNVIKQIYNERDVYRRMAKKGQRYALEKFDYMNTANDFMDVVRECMQ